MRASKYKDKFNVIDGSVVEVKRITVCQFDTVGMGNMARETTEKYHLWRDSEVGSWIMDHAIEPPEWSRFIEPQTYKVRYMITAKLTDKDYTFWVLKWDSGELIPQNY